ncbi:MAG: hypothetical protein PHN31_05710 [Candidatus Gracilibacteria bacterium]|nr:hypothetical protein [Candidatus Gracilibacteria bacterium]
MEYRDRAKSRKVKRQLLHVIDLVKLKGLNLTLPKKIILSGNVIGFFSLFFRWVDSTSSISDNIGGAFSSLAGKTGLSLLIVHILVFFLIFSKKNKDKLKLSIDSHIKDFSLVIISGVIITILGINAFFYVDGLQHFSSDIIYGPGVIAEISAGIMIIVGGFLLRSDFYKNINKVYINESEDEEQDQVDEESNMSLPF